jgi:DNA-binding transcriptional ArsR family regulator
VRILRAPDDRSRNRHRLAETLSHNYKTVEHHLAVLVDHGLVDCTDSEYGTVYFTTDLASDHWSTVEDIADAVDV